MHGFQLTFFTQQDRKHDGQPLAHWLLETARQLGISGATLFAAAEGFGHEGKLRSARFFELSEQPLEVTMAVSAEEAAQLLHAIRAAGVNVRYLKSPIEFGMTGDL